MVTAIVGAMLWPATARCWPPRRSARRLGGVLAVVLLGHGLLIDGLAPAPPAPPGLAPRPAVVVLAPLGSRPSVQPNLQPNLQPGPLSPEVSGGSEPAPAVRAQHAARPDAPITMPPAMPIASPLGTTPAGPVPHALAPAPTAPASEPVPPDRAAPGQWPPATALTMAQPGEQEPLPVYATRLPPPVRLRYRLQWLGPAGPRDGEASLDWWHDGQRYRLTLEARLPGPAGQAASRDGGRPWLQQSSEGRIDAAGLAPERFVDRRASRSAQAANFRRDDGPPHIAYSGSDSRQPLPAGAQDRLSWIAQLAAVAAAAEPALPDRLSLWVSDARGWAEAWHWQPPDDEVRLAGADPAWPPARWQRLPSHPDGLQLWLWPQAAEGLARHWPARLHQQRARGDQALRLELVEALPATPP